jgi:hypothetical protein
MKIRTVEAQMFHASRLTGMTMLRAIFCNFAKPPNNDEAENVGLSLFLRWRLEGKW